MKKSIIFLCLVIIIGMVGCKNSENQKNGDVTVDATNTVNSGGNETLENTSLTSTSSSFEPTDTISSRGNETPKNQDNKTVDIPANTANSEKNDSTKDLLNFDFQKHTVIINEEGGNRIVLETMEELEEFIKESGYGIIIECKMVNGSISRFYTSHAPLISGETGNGKSRYMTTEVEITKIHFKGLDVPLKNGDKINVYENYYYVSEETPGQLKYYDIGTILSQEWYPMEKGKTYILFGWYEDYKEISEEEKEKTWWSEYPKEQYPIIQPYHWESLYCISVDEAPSVRAYNYDEMWKDVKNKYK